MGILLKETIGDGSLGSFPHSLLRTSKRHWIAVWLRAIMRYFANRTLHTRLGLEPASAAARERPKGWPWVRV